MSEEVVDLAAYPVIRIDQVYLLSVETLKRTINDVEDILLHSDAGKRTPLELYLQKQLNCMVTAMEKKSAEERVLALITGANLISSRDEERSLLNKITSSSTQDGNFKSKDNFSYSTTPTPYVPSTSFSPLPLPSEILARQSNLDRCKEQPKSEIISSMALSSNKRYNDTMFKTEETNSRHRTRKKVESSSTRTAVSSGNISFNNAPAIGAAMDVVNQKFGSMFIVAATEKKKRFVAVKKPTQQSIEETKKNDKIERRRQAMQRLLKRQEERKIFHANKRLEREEARRIKATITATSTSEHGVDPREKPTPSPSLPLRGNSGKNIMKSIVQKSLNNNDSSDTESISGGDDDIDIANAVDEQLVNVVTKAASRKKPMGDRKIRTFKEGNSIITASANRNILSKKEDESTATAIAEKGKILYVNNKTVVIPIVQIRDAITETTDDVLESDNKLEAKIEEKNLAALQSLRKLKEIRRETSRSATQLMTTNDAAAITILELEASSESQSVRAQSASALSSCTAKMVSPRPGLITSRSANEQVEVPTCVVEPTLDRPARLQIVEHVENGLVTYILSSPEAIIPVIEAWEDTSSPNQVGLALNIDLYSNALQPPTLKEDFSSLIIESDTKTTFFGLVLLLKYLIHAFPLLSEESECSLDIFLAAWLECLYRFDDRVDIWLLNSRFQRDFDDNISSYDRMNPVAVGSTLLREVRVCQGLYSACDKLHKVLIYHSLNLVRYKYLHCFLPADDSASSIVKDIPAVGNDLSTENDDSDNSDEALLTHPDDDASIQYDTELVGNEGGDIGDCIGSDDESILPIYDNFTHPLVEASSAPNDEKVIIETDPTIRNKSSMVVGNPAGFPISITQLNRPKLSDIYTNIGMIFPVAYNQYGLSKQHNDSSASARSLLESMHVQAKVYDEWVEVMSDYSTVFSEDREIKENSTDVDSASAMVYKGGSRCLHYRVKSPRIEVSNIIKDVFESSEVLRDSWVELPTGLGLGVSWNVLWTWSKPRINMVHLNVWQKVNHFVDSKQLTRKDLLKKNIQRYSSVSALGMAEFDLMPQTFVLPHEYTLFVQSFTQLQASAAACGEGNGFHYWIMKPVGLSRGRGILLVKDLSDLTYSQESVIQRYIERPLCLDGYKFDLRLYVLVTSFQPLEAFIYKDGFARVSTAAYSLDPQTMTNKFIHLTNSSIQKQNTEGPSSDNPLLKHSSDVDDDVGGGSKIALLGPHGLWARLQVHQIDTDALWTSICTVVLKSLAVVDDKMVYQPCCFEMFGYDILIDSDLKPWLLEVNASPSLGRETRLDVRVKNAMIADIIRLLDPAPYDRAALARVLKRRLGKMAKSKFSFQAKNDNDLESDLREILGDKYYPRRYGEMPAYLGNYDMLCPHTKSYERVLKLKKKMFKSS